VLSVLLRYTDSEYPFGIFKLVLLFFELHYVMSNSHVTLSNNQSININKNINPCNW